MKNSHISKNDIQEPLRTPHGELIYELIGRAKGSLSSQRHSLALVVLPSGKASLRHFHLQSEESYFVLRGNARIQLDGREFALATGESCLIRPGQVHQISNPGDRDLEFLAVCVPAWYPEDSFEPEGNQDAG